MRIAPQTIFDELQASIRRLAAASPLLVAAVLGLTALSLAAPGCAKRPGEEIAAAPDPAAAPNEPLPECKLAGMDPPGLPITEEQRAEGIPCVRYDVPIGDAPSRGPADAPITIVMFSDFECPYCREGLNIVKRLESEYAGKIRFAYKAFPIDRHPNAMAAALMAYSARAQGKFWPFHDLLFSQRGLDPDTLLDYCERVGLDIDAVQADMRDLKYAVPVRKDIRQARKLMVRSTPTFFLNGRRITGAQSVFDFRDVIDEELGFVEQWRDAGVPEDELYQYATQNGYTELVFEGQEDRLDPDKVYPVPLQDSPARGPSTAPLTVVVFGDFQCPYCARGFQILSGLEVEYEGKIRVVYKHYPLPGHAAAIPAARASMAAIEQDGFWAFHDALYARQAKFSSEDLDDIAEEIGLDVSAWRKNLAAKAHDDQIKADIELGARLRVDGTPTYFVNGRPVSGAQSAFEFKLLFAEELQRARQQLEQGTPPEQIYETLVGL